MPLLTCNGCGNTTNTAVSHWMEQPEGTAEYCFAFYKDGKWHKGCGYEKILLVSDKNVVDRLINKA